MSSHFIKQLNTKCRFRGGLFDKLDDKLNPLLELKEDMLWGILSKLIESFKFASHKKITKLEWRPWILVKLSFRELAIQSFYLTYFKWVKVFKSRPSKICGTQPLKKFEVIRTIYKVPKLKFGDFQTPPPLCTLSNNRWRHKNNRCTLLPWPLPPFERTHFMDMTSNFLKVVFHNTLTQIFHLFKKMC